MHRPGGTALAAPGCDAGPTGSPARSPGWAPTAVQPRHLLAMGLAVLVVVETLESTGAGHGAAIWASAWLSPLEVVLAAGAALSPSRAQRSRPAWGRPVAVLAGWAGVVVGVAQLVSARAARTLSGVIMVASDLVGLALFAALATLAILASLARRGGVPGWTAVRGQLAHEAGSWWLLTGAFACLLGVDAARAALASAGQAPVAAVAFTLAGLAGCLWSAALWHGAARPWPESGAGQSATQLVAGGRGLLGNRHVVVSRDRFLAALGRHLVRPDAQVAVLCFDLGPLGHPDLARQVGQRLGHLVVEAEDLGSLGGGVFGLLTTLNNPNRDVAMAVRGVLAELGDPLRIAGESVVPVPRIGVAISPVHGQDPAVLLDAAGMARDRAVEEGNGAYQVYRPVVPRAQERLNLEQQLHLAIQQGELVLHYQPQVSLATGEVVGMEALVRWQHPRFGLLSPDRFIELAEETEVILALGRWVLGEACRQARAWQDAGFPRLSMAVNVSARQFHRGGLSRDVAWALARSGLDPGLLELELTETLALGDLEPVGAVLAELRALGVRCSIDDFGAGFTSTDYLSQLPVDRVKVDRSFVAGLGETSVDRALVLAVMVMARSLGLNVVAEGVETKEQLAFLREMGCHVAQGWLFSPALPPLEMERFIRRHRPGGSVFLDGTGQPWSWSSASLAAVSGAGVDPVGGSSVPAIPRRPWATLLPEAAAEPSADPEIVEAIRSGALHWVVGRQGRVAIVLGSLVAAAPLSLGLASAGALPHPAQEVADRVFSVLHVGLPPSNILASHRASPLPPVAGAGPRPRSVSRVAPSSRSPRSEQATSWSTSGFLRPIPSARAGAARTGMGAAGRSRLTGGGQPGSGSALRSGAGGRPGDRSGRRRDAAGGVETSAGAKVGTGPSAGVGLGVGARRGAGLGARAGGAAAAGAGAAAVGAASGAGGAGPAAGGARPAAGGARPASAAGARSAAGGAGPASAAGGQEQPSGWPADAQGDPGTAHRVPVDVTDGAAAPSEDHPAPEGRWLPSHIETPVSSPTPSGPPASRTASYETAPGGARPAPTSATGAGAGVGSAGRGQPGPSDASPGTPSQASPGQVGQEVQAPHGPQSTFQPSAPRGVPSYLPSSPSAHDQVQAQGPTPGRGRDEAQPRSSRAVQDQAQAQVELLTPASPAPAPPKFPVPAPRLGPQPSTQVQGLSPGQTPGSIHGLDRGRAEVFPPPSLAIPAPLSAPVPGGGLEVGPEHLSWCLPGVGPDAPQPPPPTPGTLAPGDVRTSPSVLVSGGARRATPPARPALSSKGTTGGAVGGAGAWDCPGAGSRPLLGSAWCPEPPFVIQARPFPVVSGALPAGTPVPTTSLLQVALVLGTAGVGLAQKVLPVSAGHLPRLQILPVSTRDGGQTWRVAGPPQRELTEDTAGSGTPPTGCRPDRRHRGSLEPRLDQEKRSGPLFAGTAPRTRAGRCRSSGTAQSWSSTVRGRCVPTRSRRPGCHMLRSGAVAQAWLGLRICWREERRRPAGQGPAAVRPGRRYVLATVNLLVKTRRTTVAGAVLLCAPVLATGCRGPARLAAPPRLAAYVLGPPGHRLAVAATPGQTVAAPSIRTTGADGIVPDGTVYQYQLRLPGTGDVRIEVVTSPGAIAANRAHWLINHYFNNIPAHLTTWRGRPADEGVIACTTPAGRCPGSIGGLDFVAGSAVYSVWADDGANRQEVQAVLRSVALR